MVDFPPTLEYKFFDRKHADYRDKEWAKFRALYSGGAKLLENEPVMKEVFPKHGSEDDDVYKERTKRAYYLPYPAEILDGIVAALTADPLTVKSEPKADSYYDDFYADCSKPGGKKQALAQLLREQILTALLCRTAWTLVDLPAAPKDAVTGLPTVYPNAKAQADAGALDAYACVVPPECVVDWEMDDTEALEWALVKYKTSKRAGLTSDRDTVTETFLYYTREQWARYEVTHKTDQPMTDGTEVKLIDSGNHSFGAVPLVRLQLPDGLHAMGKIASIAIELFNKRCALSWAHYKALYPVPVAYLSAGDPMNAASEDDGRATSQKHGPGYMRVMAEKDRMEYFSPDSAPFAIASDDCKFLRDEMHRVLHNMAMSVDNSGAALQRSADSKAIDQAVTAVVLQALAGYLREHVLEIYNLIQTGRQDTPVTFSAIGMEDFDDTTSASLIEQALNLEAVRIPSATFQAEYKYTIAKRLLGKDADQETLETIREELESAISQEDLIESAKVATGLTPPAENPKEPAGAGGDDAGA